MKKIFSSPSSIFELTFSNGGGFISKHSISPQDLEFFQQEFLNEPALSIIDSKLFFKAPVDMLNLYLRESKTDFAAIRCKRLLEKDLINNTYDFLFYEDIKFLKPKIRNILPYSLITFSVQNDLVGYDYNPILIKTGLFLGEFTIVYINGVNVNKEIVFLADVNGEIEFVYDVFYANEDEEGLSNLNIFNSYESICSKFNNKFFIYGKKKVDSIIPVEDATSIPLYASSFAKHGFILSNNKGLSKLQNNIRETL